jgi:hypothetical protein
VTSQRALLLIAPFLAAFAAGTYCGFRPDTPAVPEFSLTAKESPGRLPEPAAHEADVTQPAPDSAEPDPGVPFVGPRGDFRVTFPAPPAVTRLPAGPMYPAADRFGSSEGERTFEVIRVELTRTPSNPAPFLAGFLDGFAKQVRPDRPAVAIELNGRPGREVVGRKAKGLRVRARVYAAGDRAFLAAVCAPTDGGLRDAAAARFFNSLEIN